MAAQFPQIGLRMTNRQLSERLPLNPQELAALQAVAQDPHADLQLRTAHADMEEAAHILGASDRIRCLCRELHHEAMSEIRWTAVDTQRTRDEIDIVTLELSEKDAAAMKLLARPDIVALLRQQEGGAALEQRAPEPTARALRLPLNEVLIAGPPASVYSSSPAHTAAREE